MNLIDQISQHIAKHPGQGLQAASAVAALALTAFACGGAIDIKAPEHPPSPDAIKQLWIDPGREARQP